MKKADFLNNYWRFYLLMEDKFVKALPYVELCEDNYGTYSIEFVSQLREIGSEIDVIMKELCGFSQTERKTMSDYAPKMIEEFPNIKNQTICGRTIEIKPFENWDLSKAASSLEWWDAYNWVKHGRTENFPLAKMENIFNALGALFILNNYLLKKVVDQTGEFDDLKENSSLFRMKDWQTKAINTNECITVLYGGENALTEKE